MKYPKKQYETLVRCLDILGEHFDLLQTNIHSLHYTVYQQFSDGQSHNHLFIDSDGDIVRRHRLDDLDGWSRLINPMFLETFDLYPVGCDDRHIETAMKKALKEVGSKTNQ